MEAVGPFWIDKSRTEIIICHSRLSNLEKQVVSRKYNSELCLHNSKLCFPQTTCFPEYLIWTCVFRILDSVFHKGEISCIFWIHYSETHFILFQIHFSEIQNIVLLNTCILMEQLFQTSIKPLEWVIWTTLMEDLQE